ncbi:NAD+ synthase [Nanoarchaeota archaeon]
MIKMKETDKKLVNGIKDYFDKAGLKKAVLGISGGVDSAVTAALAVKAIGKENVIGLSMPHLEISSPESIIDAKNLCNQLDIKLIEIPINKLENAMDLDIPWEQSKLASANTKARLRAVLLYNYANSNKALVLGTSNKTEIKLGYFTKYGDGAVDFEVIGGLYKTEVVKLAKHLNIPYAIITKTPSAELMKGQTDEQEIGAPYSEVDKILKEIEAGKTPETEIGKKIAKMIKDNKHKTEMLPVLKV